MLSSHQGAPLRVGFGSLFLTFCCSLFPYKVLFFLMQITSLLAVCSSVAFTCKGHLFFLQCAGPIAIGVPPVIRRLWLHLDCVLLFNWKEIISFRGILYLSLHQPQVQQ
nr:uncharacterized protein LOC127314553 [Lolium perenne]